MAYWQWALTIPKRLRVFFRYDGTLFKGLSTLFVDVLTDWMRTVLGRDDVRPAVVACDQTFGTLLGYHPHQHVTASDGAFALTGEFVPMSRTEARTHSTRSAEYSGSRESGW